MYKEMCSSNLADNWFMSIIHATYKALKSEKSAIIWLFVTKDQIDIFLNFSKAVAVVSWRELSNEYFKLLLELGSEANRSIPITHISI